MGKDAATLIFDIGCHTGQDSDFYLKKGFRVVAVEANPDLCANLKNRFQSHISDGNLILIEKAISANGDQVTFFTCPSMDVWGTTSPDAASRNAARGSPCTEIVVPAVPFSSLLKQFGMPYYLKIDIEGCDEICLADLMSFDERPAFISTEVEGPFLLRQTMKQLSELGYSKFKVIDQSYVPNQIPPLPAKEGRYVSHEFEFGSSGLFGTELPGSWASPQGAAVRYYLSLVSGQLRKRLMKDDRGHWYDIHAAF